MCVGAEKGQPSKFKAAASTAATSKMACAPPPAPSKEHGKRLLVKLMRGNLIGWRTFSVYSDNLKEKPAKVKFKVRPRAQKHPAGNRLPPCLP